MKDLVTVFTPVYNRKNLIGNLYQSLLSQTYKNFEWIIVDDGSTDDIDEIIKSYQNEDRILIRFIKQENGGKHRAINNGVLHAKGELFYIVDSDDYLTKDSIEGFPLYDSIFEIICCVKPVFCAISFCVKFFSFRIFFRHLAIL